MIYPCIENFNYSAENRCLLLGEMPTVWLKSLWPFRHFGKVKRMIQNLTLCGNTDTHATMIYQQYHYGVEPFLRLHWFRFQPQISFQNDYTFENRFLLKCRFDGNKVDFSKDSLSMWIADILEITCPSLATQIFLTIITTFPYKHCFSQSRYVFWVNLIGNEFSFGLLVKS